MGVQRPVPETEGEARSARDASASAMLSLVPPKRELGASASCGGERVSGAFVAGEGLHTQWHPSQCVFVRSHC